MRYFVPLNFRGHLALGLKLHRKAADILPEKVVDVLAGLRGRWNARKRMSPQPVTGQ